MLQLGKSNHTKNCPLQEIHLWIKSINSRPVIACGELGELNQVSDTHKIQNETHKKDFIPYGAFFRASLAIAHISIMNIHGI